MSTTPRRGQTPAKSKKSNRLAARTWFAASFEIPLAEIADARTPTHTPWKSPLDRATYPRGGYAPTQTETYEAWLSASVADLAAHYGNAYVDAQGSKDLKARKALAAARILTATAAALIAGNIDALEKLSARAKPEASRAVRVPTRLHVRQSGKSSSCEVPFFVGGHEIAKTSAREADALLFYFVSRIRLATISLDGEPRTTKLIAEAMAREFVASAPRLAFARSTLDPDAKDRLAKKFAQLLHDCKPRRWARNDNAEQLLARARADEEDFERIAPRFARAALSVWGYTPQEARNLFDFRRKRVDRAIDASLNAGR